MLGIGLRAAVAGLWMLGLAGCASSQLSSSSAVFCLPSQDAFWRRIDPPETAPTLLARARASALGPTDGRAPIAWFEDWRLRVGVCEGAAFVFFSDRRADAEIVEEGMMMIIQ